MAKMHIFTVLALVLCVFCGVHGFPFHAPSGVVSMDAGLASPGNPSKCVAPPLMEGYMSEFLMPGYTTIISKFSYDANEKRMRVSYSVAGASPSIIHDILLLYKTGVSYDRDVVAGSCSKGTLQGFPAKKVPQNATFTGRIFIGKSFVVDNWTYSTANPNPSVVSMAWAGDGTCYPISETHLSAKASQSYSYFNLTLGIKDSAVWELPQGCEQASLARPQDIPRFFFKN